MVGHEPSSGAAKKAATSGWGLAVGGGAARTTRLAKRSAPPAATTTAGVDALAKSSVAGGAPGSGEMVTLRPAAMVTGGPCHAGPAATSVAGMVLPGERSTICCTRESIRAARRPSAPYT